MYLPITQKWVLCILLAITLLAIIYIICLLLKKLSFKIRVALLIAVSITTVSWFVGLALWLKIVITIFLVFFVWMLYEMENAPIMNDDMTEEYWHGKDIFS